MLLLGALFALFIVGFWCYCLIDVALTPRSECRGLPKGAWFVIVAGTFAVGGVVWLAARQPARAALNPPAAAAGRADGGRDRGGRAGRNRAARSRAGDVDRGQPGRDEADPDTDGPAPPLPPEGRDRPLPRNGRPAQHDWDGQADTGWDVPAASASLEAEAALLRHPAGRSRRDASGRTRPIGPDDDPEFLCSLDKAIHGREAGDDPAE